METGLSLSGVAQPARVVVYGPYPVKEGPDAELVEAPSQLLPRASQPPTAWASTRGGGAVPSLGADIVGDPLRRGPGSGLRGGAGHVRK